MYIVVIFFLGGRAAESRHRARIATIRVDEASSFFRVSCKRRRRRRRMIIQLFEFLVIYVYNMKTNTNMSASSARATPSLFCAQNVTV